MNEFEPIILLLAAAAWLAFCFGIFWVLGGLERAKHDEDEQRLMEWAGAAMWVFWLGIGYIFGGMGLLEFIAVALAAISLSIALVLTILDAINGRQFGVKQFLLHLRRMLFAMPVRFLDGL